MTAMTRKERQKELRAKEQKRELETNAKSLEQTEEIIFKEQKQRLRKQLNDVPVIAFDSDGTEIKPNRLQTRVEIRKQKKIDDILKDIAVLPEDEYLDEDTNLRILKKMSVAKQYNRLQLSSDQEEKMMENKERFDTITNQLWFMIQELEGHQAHEPKLGKVPTLSREQQQQSKEVFDYEKEKEATKRRFEELNRKDQTTEELENLSATVERKLSEINLEDHSDLTVVLDELDNLIQDEKKIAQEEVIKQNYQVDGHISPDDTLELLNFLQELEDKQNELSKTQVIKEQPVLPKTAVFQKEELVEQPTPKVLPQQSKPRFTTTETNIDLTQINTAREQEAVEPEPRKEPVRLSQTATVQPQSQKVTPGRGVTESVVAPRKEVEGSYIKDLETAFEKNMQKQSLEATGNVKSPTVAINHEDALKQIKEQEKKVESTKEKTEKKAEAVDKVKKELEDKMQTSEVKKALTEVETDLMDKKTQKIRTSIYVLLIIFVVVLIISIALLAYMIMSGQITF